MRGLSRMNVEQIACTRLGDLCRRPSESHATVDRCRKTQQTISFSVNDCELLLAGKTDHRAKKQANPQHTKTTTVDHHHFPSTCIIRKMPKNSASRPTEYVASYNLGRDRLPQRCRQNELSSYEFLRLCKTNLFACYELDTPAKKTGRSPTFILIEAHFIATHSRQAAGFRRLLQQAKAEKSAFNERGQPFFRDQFSQPKAMARRYQAQGNGLDKIGLLISGNGNHIQIICSSNPHGTWHVEGGGQ